MHIVTFFILFFIHLISRDMQVQPPQSVPLQPYQQLINEIMKLHVTQKEQLEKMKVIQKQVMMHPQKDTFTMLDNEQVYLLTSVFVVLLFWKMKVIQRSLVLLMLGMGEIYLLTLLFCVVCCFSVLCGVILLQC